MSNFLKASSAPLDPIARFILVVNNWLKSAAHEHPVYYWSACHVIKAFAAQSDTVLLLCCFDLTISFGFRLKVHLESFGTERTILLFLQHSEDIWV